MPNHCGAKKRDGGMCRQPGMKNGRCRLHGGKSTGPKNLRGNTNRMTHGFYSDALTLESLEVYNRSPIGDLDAEIRLMRTKLHRLVKLSEVDDIAGLIDSTIEIAKKQEKRLSGTKSRLFNKIEISVKAARYGELIIEAVKTLANLEISRVALLKAAADGLDEPPDERPIGRIVVEVVNALPAFDHDRTAIAVLPAPG